MRTLTFGELKTRSRERADMVNSQFISNTELEGLVNESMTELYDMLVTTLGADYYVTDTSFQLVSGQSVYSLPIDFYKMAGVDLASGSGKAVSLRPFQFQERNRFNNALIYDSSTNGFTNLRYRIIGNDIKFIPEVSSNQTVTLWYHPACEVLTNDLDTFNGVNGYEELVIVLTAIKMLSKEESDTSSLERRYQYLIKRIQDSAANRDAGSPERVQDVSRGGFDSDYCGDL